MMRSFCFGVCFFAAAWCVAQQSHVSQTAPGQSPGSRRQVSPTYPRVPAPGNVVAAPSAAHYPKVIFHNGLLTIQAQNSSLAEVLTAVHHATGASLEMPPTANNERVAVNLGPAPPNQVLASLLNGAPYDYVLLGRPQNPGDLQTVILRAKAAGNEAGATEAYSAPPEPEPAEQPDAEPEVQEVAPTEQPDQPPVEQPNPAQAQPDQQQQPGAQQGNGENQPKTPEQLLEELKRMQMQQQQQQQQQGPQQGPVPQQQPQEGQPQQPDEQQPQPQQPQPQEADTPPQNPIN